MREALEFILALNYRNRCDFLYPHSGGYMDHVRLESLLSRRSCWTFEPFVLDKSMLEYILDHGLKCSPGIHKFLEDEKVDLHLWSNSISDIKQGMIKLKVPKLDFTNFTEGNYIREMENILRKQIDPSNVATTVMFVIRESEKNKITPQELFNIFVEVGSFSQNLLLKCEHEQLSCYISHSIDRESFNTIFKNNQYGDDSLHVFSISIGKKGL